MLSKTLVPKKGVELPYKATALVRLRFEASKRHGKLETATDTSVGRQYPAPDAAEACALLDGLCLVHEGDALAQVEVGLFLAVHAINLDQRGVVVLICLAPAVSMHLGTGRGAAVRTMATKLCVTQHAPLEARDGAGNVQPALCSHYKATISEETV